MDVLKIHDGLPRWLFNYRTDERGVQISRALVPVTKFLTESLRLPSRHKNIAQNSSHRHELASSRSVPMKGRKYLKPESEVSTTSIPVQEVSRSGRNTDVAATLSKRSCIISFLLVQARLLPINERCAYAKEGGVIEKPVIRKQKADDKRPQFQKLIDGLQVLDIREGGGASPALGEKVVVHYYARLAAKQGWRFDSTYEHKDATGDAVPFEFVVGSSEVIAGLSSALLSMKVGGTRRAIIPPNLGYQTMQDLPLPPNYSDRQRLFTTIFNPTRLANGEGSTLGTLVFDIQLLAIRTGA